MVIPTEPLAYLAEHVRDAIVRETHELGITVVVTQTEARLDGCVETEERRMTVEAAARGVLGEHVIVNRIEVAPPAPVEGDEELS